MKFVIVKYYLSSGKANYGLYRYNIWFKIFGQNARELEYILGYDDHAESAISHLKHKAIGIAKAKNKKAEILEVFDVEI